MIIIYLQIFLEKLFRKFGGVENSTYLCSVKGIHPETLTLNNNENEQVNRTDQG